ncbi:MAG: hypothetical protein IT381_07220 [Deltaproteobacteria bacterium]|nr:hypothetical protein [Deltaproteobacteria bacterium]
MRTLGAIALSLLISCIQKAPGPAVATGTTGPTGSTGTERATTDPSVDPTPPPAASRLTRLRLNGKPAAAGTDPEESYTFRDETLGVDCSFEQVNDAGDWRCIPRNATGAVYFKDTDCKQPIAFWRSACGAKVPTYARKWTPSNDAFHRIWAMRVDLYRVGAKTSAPATIYSRGYDGSCEPPEQTPLGDPYTLTADDGAALAHGKFEWKKGTSGRIAQARIVPDEAGPIADFFIGQAFDYEADASCMVDTTFACTLSVSQATSAFSDNLCKNAVSTVSSPRKLAKNASGEIRKITTSATAQPVYDDESGTCAAAPAPRYVVTFGAKVTQATGKLTTVGTGRVRDERVEIDGLSFLVQHIDSEADGVGCYAVDASDGTMRCVPTSSWLRRLYTEPQCQTAELAGDLRGEPVGKYATILEDSCGDHSTIVAVGAKHTTPPVRLFYKNAFGECLEEENAVDDMPDRFDIGAVVPPSTFGEMP